MAATVGPRFAATAAPGLAALGLGYNSGTHFVGSLGESPSTPATIMDRVEGWIDFNERRVS